MISKVLRELRKDTFASRSTTQLHQQTVTNGNPTIVTQLSPNQQSPRLEINSHRQSQNDILSSRRVNTSEGTFNQKHSNQNLSINRNSHTPIFHVNLENNENFHYPDAKQNKNHFNGNINEPKPVEERRSEEKSQVSFNYIINSESKSELSLIKQIDQGNSTDYRPSQILQQRQNFQQTQTLYSENIEKGNYLEIIKKLTQKIEALVNEIDRLSNITNNLIQDNQIVRDQYNKLRYIYNSVFTHGDFSILNSENQYINNNLKSLIQISEKYKEHSDQGSAPPLFNVIETQIMLQEKQREVNQLLEENNSLQNNLHDYQCEANTWREQYDHLLAEEQMLQQTLRERFKEELEREIRLAKIQISSQNLNTETETNWLQKYLELQQQKDYHDSIMQKRVETLQQQLNNLDDQTNYNYKKSSPRIQF